MLKRILLLIIIFICSFSVKNIYAQENDFHFSNWFFANFSKRQIINNFSENHFGLDVAADIGEDVRAVADGKVYWTYSGGSHGIAVGIEHDNGWRTTYLHLSEKLVKKGQEVKANTIIGRVGISGTGRDAQKPHLHFSLIIDAKASVNNYLKRYADPLLYAPLVSTTEESTSTRTTANEIAGTNEGISVSQDTSEVVLQPSVLEETGPTTTIPVKDESVVDAEKKKTELLETQEVDYEAKANTKENLIKKPAVDEPEKRADTNVSHGSLMPTKLKISSSSILRANKVLKKFFHQKNLKRRILTKSVSKQTNKSKQTVFPQASSQRFYIDSGSKRLILLSLIGLLFIVFDLYFLKFKSSLLRAF